LRYDALLPDGIDEIAGKVAVEIKIYRYNRTPLRLIYDTVGRISMKGGDIDTLLLIIVNEMAEVVKMRIDEEKKQLNFNLLIWNINNLVDIFAKNEQLFVETDNNINTVLLQDTISRGIARDRDTYIEKRKKYENDNIVLFLGAGASNDA
jgi:hypothetical protein